ncbi:PIN domain-like protein [Baffinella frigidus]|nr:PIN domain-like protein [Cryptophyta sp. CCMP2293]
MGIQGLLPVLKSIIEQKHVSKYAGTKVAVDTYGWIHKGCYGCSLELCTNTPTDRYVTYCVDRVKMLLHHGVIPVMIFDGADLPSKGGTEQNRKSSRDEYKAKGMHALRMQNRGAATEFFQRAIDVTPHMAHRVIKALRKLNVECIVAPYEARTRNPKPETRNPKPETRNPKPETRNPKPGIRNPKPGT